MSRFTLIGRSCPFPVWQYYNQCSWLRALEIGIFLWDPESGAINLAEVFFDFYPALTATQAHIQLTREISCQQGDQNPGGTISSLICHQPSKSLLITLSISKEASFPRCSLGNLLLCLQKHIISYHQEVYIPLKLSSTRTLGYILHALNKLLKAAGVICSIKVDQDLQLEDLASSA